MKISEKQHSINLIKLYLYQIFNKKKIDFLRKEFNPKNIFKRHIQIIKINKRSFIFNLNHVHNVSWIFYLYKNTFLIKSIKRQ
jgi:hypothetical protein